MNRPEHWLWSHDIKPDQIASLGPPGWSLVSLSSYGGLDRRRFAAVLHKGPGAGRIPVLDLDPPGGITDITTYTVRGARQYFYALTPAGQQILASLKDLHAAPSQATRRSLAERASD